VKIAYLISHLQRLGPVNVLHSIVAGLLETRACAPGDVTVITLSPERAETRLPDFTALGVEVRHLPVRARTLPAGVVALRRALRELAPDVCHSNCVKADTLLALASPGLPVVRVSTIHSIPAEDLAYTYPGVRGKLAAMLAYASLRLLRGQLVGCSSAVASHLARKIGGNVVAVRNPVVPPPGADLVIPRSATRLISAGNITELKNTRAVVERFLESERCAGLELLVFGDGPLRSELMDRHRDARLRWPGYSSRLGAEFRSARAYVSASVSEGMPLAPLEALLCGCACVLSDIPQHREVADLSRSRVFLFDPRSQRSFDDAISGVLSLNGAPSEAELAALARRLSPGGAAAEYARVYEAAIATSMPGKVARA
jgi:glycosyltransferase involved in cell wall biosynthesis